MDEYRWHIVVSAQTIVFSIDVVTIVEMSGEIMMASIYFVIQSFELIDLFCFNFAVSVFFDLVDELPTSF